ncbi:hypothetical protein TNCV_4691241 [Trichonephila clavipes]|nr:hypothetical protein TNCV_4691241 [Trichonephila clavipes]
MNKTWTKPPAHHWYAAKSPGLSLQSRRFRALQTTLARFRSGQLRGLVQGIRSTCFYSIPVFPLIFWTAGVFPWDSSLEIKIWHMTSLSGKVE